MVMNDAPALVTPLTPTPRTHLPWLHPSPPPLELTCPQYSRSSFLQNSSKVSCWEAEEAEEAEAGAAAGRAAAGAEGAGGAERGAGGAAAGAAGEPGDLTCSPTQSPQSGESCCVWLELC